ncbi:trichohyalin-like [Argopecten irradians]|uniref:trichohyalin-like n=1 Tax=Argopecten irradians TaxID=31199 RepID=UPI003718312D
MIYIIVVIVLCLIHLVGGQTLNSNGDILDINMDMILDLQSRLAFLERHQNELDKQQKIDRIKQRQTDQLRISDLEKQRQTDQLRISDLEKQRQTDQLRISDLEKQRQTDQLRISDLEKQRQTDQLRISDLEKQRQTDQLRISDLEKQRQTDQLRISDLEKQRQTDQLRISDLEKQRQTDHRRISDLGKRQRTDQRISELEISGDYYQNDTEKTRPQFTTKTTIVNAPPLGRMNRGKRVSPSLQMVAFYAILSHGYDPITNTMDIHFDQVVTNLGDAYNGQASVFTSPKNGVYVFTWMVHVNTRWVYTDLVKNGVTVGTGFAGDSDYSMAGGNTVVVQLNEGDTVWIRIADHLSGTTIVHYRNVSSFSGFLLQ